MQHLSKHISQFISFFSKNCKVERTVQQIYYLINTACMQRITSVVNTIRIILPITTADPLALLLHNSMNT